ncbi:ACP S-malonyltransferase [Saliterribacillus persicus]|uniref:Malonyl CoA-acyl carrier protein transacylase n=1 Tax=Saliterribacillus persicus TaxID=930114 RepID=A0A368XS00_9BACI|nr:ACP S-malonyltransferase [Saliterribacillus persicus]RCW70751.1 [acyl-carrier-protein] S-malonyltransferase [Saliterribacillus persicus]
MKKVAFIYPGQGSQSIGMGQDIVKNYPLARDMFRKADDLLGVDLSEFMFQGPEESLTHTVHAQPALLLVSSAITEILKQENILPNVTAGHSLGEYSALVAAKAISFEDAIKLVHKRGQLMEEAFPKGKGKMAAVLGLQKDQLEEALAGIREKNGEIVELANINCPGQIVISGTSEGIELAINKLKEAGAKRVLPLNVSGPFHSSLMKPAASKLDNELSNVEINDAHVPIFANVTAAKVKSADSIKDLLVEQLYSPVRFEEIIEALVEEELDAIVEVGSGKVLSGLVKKIDRKQKTFQLQDKASIDSFVEWYKEGEEI